MVYNVAMKDKSNKTYRAWMPTEMGKVLPAVARNLDLSGLVSRWRLFGAWRAAVGEKLAFKTEPVDLRDNVLIVRVADSAWAHELTYLKDDILHNLDKSTKGRGPKDIRFVTGSVQPPKHRSKPVADLSGIEVDPKDVASSIDTQALKDKPALRAVFEALITTSYRLKKARHGKRT